MEEYVTNTTSPLHADIKESAAELFEEYGRLVYLLSWLDDTTNQVRAKCFEVEAKLKNIPENNFKLDY